MAMSYVLRRTWPDTQQRADDYVVGSAGYYIGRIYLVATPIGDRWRWSIYVSNKVRTIPGVPTMGVAATLNAAEEDFRWSFEKMRRGEWFGS
jgi:hypothetical protein